MRVFFVSTMYPTLSHQWRGVFIRNIASALARRPELDLRIWAPPGEPLEGATEATTPRESAWLRELVEHGGISHMMRSGGLRGVTSPLRLLSMLAAGYRRNPHVDLYHINWLQSALPLPTNEKPALITALGNDLRLLQLPGMRTLLRRTMRRRQVAICPNAEWMSELLEQAFGDVARVVPVQFGIDPAWYQIRREREAASRGRWLVVSRLTVEKLGPLFEWSRPLFHDTSRELHLIGPMEQQISVPPWVHYHGPATPESLCRDWFPNATGLITLSRHSEGRPQVMLEAMAAGLPIVASNMPAHASVVQDGRTGLLCEGPDHLAACIRRVEDPQINAQMGEAARMWVRQEVGTWDDCAARYARVYEQLLGR